MKALAHAALLLLAAGPALAEPAAPSSAGPPSAALVSAAPASAEAPASAAPASAVGATITWKRLPQKAYLCSRHGPDWELGQDEESVGGRTFESPFALTVQPGQKVKFTAEAVASDKSAITYTTTGWPDGAVLDPKAGTFQWTAAGTPGQKFLVEVFARSASGAEASTALEVAVASEALQDAWKAGLGGKAWPDCSTRTPQQVVREVDLDGDGRLDVLVSNYWTDPSDEHAHRFSRHDALLRAPSGAKVLAWGPGETSDVWIGDIELAKAPGGGVLVVATDHACFGGSKVELYTVQKGAMVNVGQFLPNDPEDVGVDGAYILSVKPIPAADGTITAVEVTELGKTRRLPWHNGTFEE